MTDDSADQNKNKNGEIEQVTWFGAAESRSRQSEAPPQKQDADPLNLQQPQPQTEPAQSAPPPVAPPATSNGASNGGASTKNQSQVLAQTVVTAFTERLTAEARKRGGYLTIGDIDQLSREFDRKREALEQVFQQSFDAYVRIRERAAFDHARKFPFDRVIVNSFAHLFDRQRTTEDGPNAVTRRVLPGFFLAIDKMIGPESMEEFQERCRKIVARLSAGDETAFNWELIYADKEGQEVCLDALVTFAPYFEDIDHRRDWLIPMVNNQLDAEDNWELTEGGFDNLVDALFSDLRDRLADSSRRFELETRYGGVTCFELDRVFEKIGQAGN